ncbi:hypothetical protein J416_07037 [Gracilibacillus halophilus YIM-C55.5]|uniref:Uncharacterized protein n=1 Tax=Gracilibacillus halophilus YIM-C55.5 TaxID=1308866 RepID=N4WLY8_9BACI|nr:hypothetical protein [Gracilibacillus halophilus]ENH97177.1 hypothetical protein J416_07037 [Gracilibacillus halophilus YIM-C55.5]
MNKKRDHFLNDLEKMKGDEVLLVTNADQLNLFGQTFRPIFCGKISEIEDGQITLFPVTIKLVNAPFFEFPIPLSFPLEKISNMTGNFNCNMPFPLT